MSAVKMNRRDVLRAAAILPAAMSSQYAFAAGWPAREITYIVPFAAGGGGDLATRTLMAAVQTKLGVPIVVKNVVGASGAVAIRELIQSAPDGYVASNIGIPHLTILPRTTTLGFDPWESTELVVQFAETKFGVAVATNSPIQTIDDLIALGKKQRVNYASSSVGSVLAMYQLAKLTGANFNWVRVDSSVASATQTAGGHVDACILEPTALLPQLKSGALRLLASASTTRWAEYPDIKTLQEMGYNATSPSWIGIAFPKGVPVEVKTRMESVVEEALKDPAVREKLVSVGLVPDYASGADFRKRMLAIDKELGSLLVEIGMAK